MTIWTSWKWRINYDSPVILGMWFKWHLEMQNGGGGGGVRRKRNNNLQKIKRWLISSTFTQWDIAANHSKCINLIHSLCIRSPHDKLWMYNIAVSIILRHIKNQKNGHVYLGMKKCMNRHLIHKCSSTFMQQSRIHNLNTCCNSQTSINMIFRHIKKNKY